jgi:hypothetical protein
MNGGPPQVSDFNNISSSPRQCPRMSLRLGYFRGYQQLVSAEWITLLWLSHCLGKCVQPRPEQCSRMLSKTLIGQTSGASPFRCWPYSSASRCRSGLRLVLYSLRVASGSHWIELLLPLVTCSSTKLFCSHCHDGSPFPTLCLMCMLFFFKFALSKFMHLFCFSVPPGRLPVYVSLYTCRSLSSF